MCFCLGVCRACPGGTKQTCASSEVISAIRTDLPVGEISVSDACNVGFSALQLCVSVGQSVVAEWRKDLSIILTSVTPKGPGSLGLDQFWTSF